MSTTQSAPAPCRCQGDKVSAIFQRKHRVLFKNEIHPSIGLRAIKSRQSEKGELGKRNESNDSRTAQERPDQSLAICLASRIPTQDYHWVKMGKTKLQFKL